MSNDIMTPVAVPRSFFMTYLLISVNCLVYGLIQYSGGPTYENLLAFGAKENGLIAQGEFYRLFVPMFLHGGFLHLFFNMYALYAVGRYLEIIAGARYLLIIYLVSGFVGNLFSFCFSPALSVGASGSLFGILLTLFVIEKYQEKLSEDMGAPVQKSTLGTLIILNGIITFVIPNIDWANHLGGAVAGSLLGAVLVLKHAKSVKILQAARFWGFGKQLSREPFYKKERFYILVLITLMVGLSMQVFRVGFAEKVRGLGVKYATENQTTRRDNEYLRQFAATLSSEKSETNPDRLLQVAIRLHQLKQIIAAKRVYEVLIVFKNYNIGTDNFLSATTEHFLRVAFDAANSGQILDDSAIPDIFFSDSINKLDLIQLGQNCLHPAKTLSALGFFDIAGRLYECSYLVSPRNLQLAAHTAENYWLAESKAAFVRFLNLVQYQDQHDLTKQNQNDDNEDFRHKKEDKWFPSENDQEGAPI